MVFVAIDNRKRLVRFKKNGRRDKDYQAEKDINFEDIVEVERLNLDVYKGEHKLGEALQFKSKFMVRTLHREYFFFSKNDTERSVWIESFNEVAKNNNFTKSSGALKTSQPKI